MLYRSTELKKTGITSIPASSASIEARYSGKTVLALGAHPDDLELGVGGTLARLSRTARTVMTVVCVPSDFKIRQEECRIGAAILSAELRILVSDCCSRVEDLKTYELVSMLDDLIREYDPALVLSHGPSDLHRDHTLVFDACRCSQRLKAFDLLCYHPTSTRSNPIPFNPKAFVDITQTISLKMDAIAAHATQFRARGLNTDVFREIAREEGRMAGVEYAEGLEVGRLLLN